MANSTKVAVLFGILVFMQVSCAVSRPHTQGPVVKSLAANVLGVMTVNSFQQGEGGSKPAACDGQFHSDQELVVSLSSEWFEGGARCGKSIRIEGSANLKITAKVVDECQDCEHQVGASTHIWKNLNLDPNVGLANIRWSDITTWS